MSANRLPVAVAFASALLWGVWWGPVRLLEGVGVGGAWAGVMLVGAALPALLLFQFFRPSGGPSLTVRIALSGALIGGAMAFYTAAIAETTVLRAVLIFYLAPVWAILIECVWLGRKFRWGNGLAFALAAVGILTIFRFDIAVAGWTIGDTFALMAGISWAIGSALVFTGPDVGAVRLTIWGCVGGVLVSLAIILAFAQPAPVFSGQAAGIAMLTGTIYIAPVTVATLWSARRLAPTTLAFLLTGEIVSGVATAAWFLTEPFGWPELLGTVLIVSAAVVEVILPKPETNPAT
ncbi:MAG: DMT family transporter [Pseudomonadota bacterium]